jgi:alpha-mannosidase
VFDQPDSALPGSSAVVLAPARVVQAGPLRAVIEADLQIGGSHLVQRTTLTAGSPRVDIEVDVDWRERESTLAAHLPVSVLAGHSSASIQFGHLQRATHENTSWEAARHEMVAHRWLHVGEAGWGLALVNESSYGHSMGRTVIGSEPVTMLRLTLLRGASFPDPEADRGRHLLRFGIVAGADIGAAIRHGYEVALPVLGRALAQESATDEPATDEPATSPRRTPFIDVDDAGCVIEAVKLAEDGSGDVVVRCYEALGGRRRVTLTFGFEVSAITETDLLEDGDGLGLDGRRALQTVDGNRIRLALKPFQIVTLRLRRR